MVEPLLRAEDQGGVIPDDDGDEEAFRPIGYPRPGAMDDNKRDCHAMKTVTMSMPVVLAAGLIGEVTMSQPDIHHHHHYSGGTD